MKRWISMTLIMVMVFSLAACGSSGGNAGSGESAGSTGNTAEISSKEPDEKTAEGQSIEVWTRGSETDVHAAAFIQACKAFEEKTGVEVNYQFISHDDVVTKWNSAFASGTAPDVIDLGIVHLIERINLEHIVPLNDYVENWDGKDDIYQATLDVGSLNDKIYAIGHFPDPNIFVYRKDMFEEAGIDASRPPADWTEMLQYAQKLVETDGSGNVTRAGFAVPTLGARFLANILVRQNGGHFADEENNVPTMTSKEAIEAFEYMADLHKTSLIYDNSQSDSNPLLMDAAAMGYIANGVFSNYISNNPDMADKFGVAACVPGVTDAAWNGIWFYAITSQARDNDLAWQLIEHMTSYETLSTRIEMAGIPTTFASTADEFIALNPQINEAIIDAVTIGAGNPKVSWAPLYEIALDTAAEEVFYGVKDVEQALTDAQEYLMQEIN